MTRYENTIIAMFTGHTHRDEFELFYRDDEGERAAVINYVGPAATPYSDANPGFRVYEVRPSARGMAGHSGGLTVARPMPSRDHRASWTPTRWTLSTPTLMSPTLRQPTRYHRR